MADARPNRHERVWRRRAIAEYRRRLRVMGVEDEHVDTSASSENDDEGNGLPYDENNGHEVPNHVCDNDCGCPGAQHIVNADADLPSDNDQPQISSESGSEQPHLSSDSGSEEGGSVGSLGDDNDSNASDDFQPELYMVHTLREWAMRGVSKRKVDSLLFRLHRVHPTLPLSYKTLLNTPLTTDVANVAHGQMWYKGIRRNLSQIVTQEYVDNNETIEINISFDGLPLYRSARAHFWPILGMLAKPREPFIVAVWYDQRSKPSSVDEFLHEFINEVTDLMENGFTFGNTVYPVAISNVICDAQARSFAKCCVAHNGTYSCEKCEVRGRCFHHRMTYVDINARRRTDESFRQRRNRQHHTGISPLEARLNFGMVSKFRLEYQHLVCLGVMKRLLRRLLEVRNHGRLRDEDITAFKEALAQSAPHFPREFNRKPRFFENVGVLKATELRRLLLYDCVKLFRDFMGENVYRHFLLFHCAIFILASPLLVEQPAMVDAAEEFLNIFVQHCPNVYGQDFVVYNVHSLTHLASECREHGCVDSFSAFPFENFLKTIKDCLRSGYHPLQQLARRDHETGGHLQNPTNIPEGTVLKMKHVDMNEEAEGDQYKFISFKGLTMCLKGNGDRCFKANDGAVVLLTNIVQTDGQNIVLRGQRFQVQENYYDYPIESSLLGIVLVSELDDVVESWNVDDVLCKCILLPENNEDFFLCLPLLHTLS